MSVAIVIDDQWEVSRCLLWGARFADAVHESLLVVVLEEGSGDPQLEILAEGDKPSLVAAAVFNQVATAPELRFFSADSDDKEADASAVSAISNADSAAEATSDATEDLARAATEEATEKTEKKFATPVRVAHLKAGDKTQGLLQFVKQHSPSLLILPRHRTHRGLDDETPWEHAVYRRASCATLLLCPGGRESGDSSEMSTAPAASGTGEGGVLAPVDDGRTTQTSLGLAKQLSDSIGEPLTALYVEPNVGDVARDVGRRIVDRVVRRALGGLQAARRDVVIGESVRESIHEYAERGSFSLIVLGANRIGVGRRWLKMSISEWMMGKATKATVAVIRPALPLAHRFTTQIADWLRHRVPQLDREARISLYERIQSSSRWNFDFIALICLSTIIATLGLIQNSAAVVIGAMLVAPLMTPLVGAGLALVQGNRVLLIGAWGTVLRGFLVAFFIGFVVGLCVPGLTESREMLARGSPSVLDLGVALIGGVAASYALGRPNLFSALPGVAIAAALVPPIATAGLAASLGNFRLASGALLLFATNIVAIVLGTAISLFAVGVRASHEHGVVESWVRRIAVVLVVIAFVIGVYEIVPHGNLPAKLEEEVARALAAQNPPAELQEATLASSERVQLTIHSATPLGAEVRKRLAGIVRESLNNDAVRVEIENRLVSVELPTNDSPSNE